MLERLILRRLANLQRKRGQDWIRSLLVQGFLAEGCWLRTGEPGGSQSRVPVDPAIPTTPFARWLQGAHDNGGSDQEPVPRLTEAPTTAPSTSSNAKPFAHLRKAIG